MESMKATLPDLVHSRIEDLVNGQLVGEEAGEHWQELTSRMQALLGLVPSERAEEARSLAEGIDSLAARIRRDYVTVAYKQGLRDGFGLQKLLAREAGEYDPQGA